MNAINNLYNEIEENISDNEEIVDESSEETIWVTENFEDGLKIIGIKKGTQIPTDIRIPDKIDGMKILEIASYWDVYTLDTIDTLRNNSTITTVILPQYLEKIGDAYFEGCTNLTKVVIPDNLTYIADAVFEGCTLLSNIELSSSVTTLGEFAFKGCSSLTNIDLSNVQSIGMSCFNQCALLEEVYLPNSITIIPESCFQDCTNLRKLQLGNNVTEIGRNAFSNNTNLSGEIIIPDTILKIDEGAFSQDTAIQNIKFLEYDFDSIYEDCSYKQYLIEWESIWTKENQFN